MSTKALAIVVLGMCAACTSSSGTDGGNTTPLSVNFAGTWGGPARAEFSAGGSLTYDTAMVVAVSGNMASVSGVCPDGTASVTLAGSGASALYSGTLTCPAIPISGCETVVFTYTEAALTLTGTTSLILASAGSASGCGYTYGLVTTFNGTLAATGDNPVPGWDLRFKGVGESLVASTVGGFGGGAAPGAENIFTLTGRGRIEWGLIAGGGFSVDSLYGASQTAVYQNTLWVLGAMCPENFAEALAANNVVIALDGDPNQENAICIILGVGQPDAGPTFQYLTEDAVPVGHIMEELTGSARGRSFVVTAIFAVDAGLYTYVAESLGSLADGGYEQFDTVIHTPLVAELATEAEALADAGYVITASAWQGEPNYMLVGTRPVGSAATHAAMTLMTDDLTYFVDAESMLSNGYVPVSLLQDYYSLADGGLGSDTWLIGEK
jgi:hypothetical protein